MHQVAAYLAPITRTLGVVGVYQLVLVALTRRTNRKRLIAAWYVAMPQVELAAIWTTHKIDNCLPLLARCAASQ